MGSERTAELVQGGGRTGRMLESTCRSGNNSSRDGEDESAEAQEVGEQRG